MPLLIGLQRRLLKRQHGFGKLGVVKTLREMPMLDLVHIVEMGEIILDSTARSIFLKNFRKIMASNSRVISVGANIKSPVFMVPGYEKRLLRKLQNWVKEWRHAGVFILCSLRIVSNASQSLVSGLDSTPNWSRKRKE